MRINTLLLAIVCTLIYTLSTADDGRDRTRLRAIALAYIDRIDPEVTRMLHLAKSNLTGPEVVAQSKRINVLMNEGDPIGAFPFSPYHQCRAAGIGANQLWQTMIGMVPTMTTRQALDEYRQTGKACRRQLSEKR